MDYWFSKYNRVLLHYSVSMTAAASATPAAALEYMAASAALGIWMLLLLLWGIWLLLLKCRLLLTVFAF